MPVVNRTKLPTRLVCLCSAVRCACKAVSLAGTANTQTNISQLLLNKMTIRLHRERSAGYEVAAPIRCAETCHLHSAKLLNMLSSSNWCFCDKLVTVPIKRGINSLTPAAEPSMQASLALLLPLPPLPCLLADAACAGLLLNCNGSGRANNTLLTSSSTSSSYTSANTACKDHKILSTCFKNPNRTHFSTNSLSFSSFFADVMGVIKCKRKKAHTQISKRILYVFK